MLCVSSVLAPTADHSRPRRSPGRSGTFRSHCNSSPLSLPPRPRHTSALFTVDHLSFSSSRRSSAGQIRLVADWISSALFVSSLERIRLHGDRILLLCSAPNGRHQALLHLGPLFHIFQVVLPTPLQLWLNSVIR